MDRNRSRSKRFKGSIILFDYYESFLKEKITIGFYVMLFKNGNKYLVFSKYMIKGFRISFHLTRRLYIH